jgi:hypothetical protein
MDKESSSSNNGNPKKPPAKQNYVEQSYTEDQNHATDEKRSWLTLAAWITLIGVIAVIITLAILLFSQRKPTSKIPTTTSKKGRASRQSRDLKSALTRYAGEIQSSTTTEFVFPPKDVAKELGNPSIYKPQTITSQESMVWSSPMLKFMPLRLELSSKKPTDSFWIRNDGNQDLIFNLSTNSSQISVTPTSGKLATSQVAYITVTGTGDGIVIIDSNGGYDVVKIDYKP